MRVLLALALLLWSTTDAHHSPEHRLKDPIFLVGKTTQYDFTFNLTAGIPGMTSQLAKSSILGVVSVTPKTETEFLLKVDGVKISRPEVEIQSDDEDMSYRRDASLEAELQKPIKFTLEKGLVKSYTLGKNESPETQAIKRSILRHFQGEFRSEDPEEETQEYPYTYNTTWETQAGPVKAWYIVTVSPYPEFPNNQEVYNITATDMYDYPRYTLVQEHHNFEKQGCPEVCKPVSTMDDSDYQSNQCAAGCPAGHEPYHMPAKSFWSGQYNFRREGNEMVLESLLMEETYIASMYDQDMTITISAEYVHKAYLTQPVEEPRDQQSYENLERDVLPDISRRQDMSHEASVFAELYSWQVSKAVERCTTLLNKITETVVESNFESRKSQEVGEDLILLQKVLSLLKPEHFQQVWSRIVDKRSYKSADQKEKVKRQILVDVLPLVGTSECLEFIKSLIQQDKLSAWEIKEILEALPQNLWTANKRNIQILEEIRKLPQIERQQLTLSAAYLAEARLIKEACSSVEINNLEYVMSSSQKASSRFQRSSRGRPTYQNDDEDEDESRRRFWKSPRLNEHVPDSRLNPECPEELISRFIEEVSRKLKSTQKIGEKTIYIEALANLGSTRVLPYLVPYINASAPEFESWAPADVDYFQTITLYALHHMINSSQFELLNYVAPIYFNRTETPRVRIAAFSVLIRCQPPMSVLQHVATTSWWETSNEVGSYVYSALITFGNSSNPCMQSMRQKIQHVISQCKQYDIGFQHAKSLVYSFFDEIHNFGIEKRFAYVPSNESVVPHSLYYGLSYNLDSLRDAFYKISIHMQGIPAEKLLEIVDEYVLGFKIRNIPHEKEDKIFGTAKVISKLPQTMRFFVYQQIFYSSTHIYADSKSFMSVFEPLFEHLETLFPSSGNVRKGHFIKVYIPSSIHSLSIAYTAAYPVEMEVKHPILLSLKTELEWNKSELRARCKVNPSVYYMEYHTNQIYGPASKRVYGVYHEQKVLWNMPLEFACRLHKHNQTVACDIVWSEVNKPIMKYHSEAGTYASPITLERLPSTMNRKPIETIPVMFRKERVFGVPTLPHVHVAVHTEDMSFCYDDIPRTLDQSVELAIQHLRNPGWRRKSVNVTLVPSPEGRSQSYSMRIQVSYNISLESQNLKSQSEDFQMNSMMHHDVPEDRVLRADALFPKSLGSLGLQKSEAEAIYKQIKRSPHIAHELSIEAYSWPTKAYAQLRVEMNHTFDKTEYSFTAEGYTNLRGRHPDYKACIAHVTKYGYIPSELKYKTSVYNKQQVDFYNELSLDSNCEPFRKPHLVTLGSFTHKPLQNILEEKFDGSLDESMLLPETHEKCIKDMQSGRDLTLDCFKAIRDETVYNNYRIRSEWRTEIPSTIRNITEKLNQAIKYAFYTQADIDTLVQNKKSTVEINAYYIDVLTDNPVFNIRVQTPEETVHYHKIDATYFSPPSSVFDAHEYVLHEITNNTYPPTCAIMKEHLKTYDHKMIELPEDSCTYLVSSHCASDKLFAILAKNLKGSRTELTVYLGRHEIVLHPSRGSAYPIEFDGKTHNVHIKNPVVLDEEAGIYIHVVPAGNSKYNLVLRSVSGLKVIYDGENIKIKVHPLYKGKLCGLCSEYDGEITREFRGVDQCLYLDSKDFAHSAITDSRTCGVSPLPKFPKLCDYSSDSRSGPHDDDYTPDDNSYATTSGLKPKLRTIHIQKADKICFSTQPAYMCPDGVEPKETERESLEFHCLPKFDSTTRKLIEESKYRILRELASKRVDYKEVISTAKSCHQ